MTIVHAKCTCGGEFESTNIVLTSNPPLYPHICNNCGKKINSHKIYPQFKSAVTNVDHEYEVIE